ncbi:MULTISPECIES: ATP-binding protein [unclassified Amycolatopsis]|uniref:sensor histidine kinase n=1 Tax=unclassified Amycolatopsis TaxID=2618356 RepID=UPI002875B4EF|nr:MULTISPECIES: ATP-binding protein [unclassified Amycolatopsis]MDS0132079.1 CHASE3 domain-containing protein [Amycolatopsis sp. 505]MDS0141183.1 CHASE3 domain-containing protein [Amycolatopsis sp. CM201R]
MSADVRGWPIRRRLAVLAAAETVLLVAALIAAGIALHNLTEARTRLLDVIAPQRLAATQLSTALLNQESGVRGYQLGRQPAFLVPYTDGMRSQADAVRQLRQLGATPGTQIGDDLDAVLRAATAWQDAAAPTIAPTAPPVTVDQVERGRTLFIEVRTALDTQLDHLAALRDTGRGDLDAAANFLNAMFVAVAVLVLLLFAFLFFGLRQVVTRPILRLAGQVRRVADADVHSPVRGSGPREIAQLGADVEAMRQRILDEVAELEQAHALLDRRTREAEESNAMLDRRTRELERSNADLEQFAYVASHDLQEPLRKVASFCQLLQRRYQGLLDERGEQYIEYAVDGAKRMQVLINDLLAFSRVGRKPGEHVVADAGALADDAIANLEVALSLSGGKVSRGELPEVRVEPALMTAVFQNLIGNALKFKGETPPEVRVSAERDGDDWVFSVSDNGIGIDPEYAERVFALFQRLHTRSAYPGTGIGLALCRRIVEYHGGRIWLDTEAADTTFRFTLPAAAEEGGTA